MIQSNVNVVILADHEITRGLGVYRLASEIRTHNFSCQVVDKTSQFSPEELRNIFNNVIGDKTLILGISTSFFNVIRQELADGFAVPNIDWTIISTAIKIAKKINPSLKIVIGGGWVSPLPSFDEKIDLTVTGDGEHAIIEYLKYLQQKNPFIQYSIKNDHMLIDGSTNNRFDFINSETVYHPSDNIMKGESLPFETARGCIFKCKFCSYPLLGKNKNDYIRTKESMKNELLRNYHEYGTTRYSIVDSTFNDNNIKLQQIAEIAQQLPFKLEYACYIRLDLLHAKPEQYQYLIDSGMTGCFFGIESLNERSLKSIGKGLHPDKVVEELYNFKDKMPNVGTTAGLICGLPYETENSIEEWSARVLSEDFPLDASIMIPLVIDTNPEAVYKSAFDKDSSKYYTWADPYTWHNGYFDLNWANKFCNKYELKNNSRLRVASWFTILQVAPWNTTLTKKPMASVSPWIRKQYISSFNSYKKLLCENLDNN